MKSPESLSELYKDSLGLLGSARLLVTSFTAPVRESNGILDEASDQEAGMYESESIPRHTERHGLGCLYVQAAEVEQAVEFLLGLRDTEPCPDPRD